MDGLDSRDRLGHRHGLFPTNLLPYLLLAAAVAFLVSLITIRFLLGYVSRHNFKPFGVYRIIIGVLIITLVAVQVIS